MSQITLHAPGPVATPRGAEWAANAFAAWLQFVRDAWKTTSARREHLRRVDEAVALRRVAASLSEYHPALASDLFAAADRHLGCC